MKTVVEEIHAAGGIAEFQALDVTDMADMQAFADFATQKFGRVDVLVNNAGVMPLSPLHELNLAKSLMSPQLARTAFLSPSI